MVPVKKKTKIAILIASLAVFALVLAAARTQIGRAHV